MPRDGSEQYVLPFPDVEPDTTIESAVYNGFTNDVAQDLNNPRPVSSGGTGATNPADAMQNLGGELAKYQVTNYDSHPFQAGSFYSNAGATGAPTGNAFIGICYVAVVAGSPTTDMFIEARDQTTGLLYVRQKKANVWAGWTVPAGFSPGPTPPAGSAPNALWWDTTRGKLFFYYQDPSGPPAQWVEAVAVPDIDPNTFVEIAGDSMTGFLTLNANPVNPMHAVTKQYLDAGTGAVVSYSPQTVTAAQQTIARQNIYAAPFDVMSYSGMQINGSMEVSQERGGTARTTAGYVCDGWYLFFSGTMAVSSAQAGTAISDVPGISGLTYIAVTTAQASIGASDQAVLFQNIEGYRVARLGWGTASAQSITIGFWTAHQRTGVYSITVSNMPTTNRSYSSTYTQNASGVYQYNTITIPGDTTGTWPRDNSSALRVKFAMAAGSTLTAPSVNTWGAGDYSAAPGQINGVAATSDAFRITGVVVLPGIEAPTAARSPLIMRPYDQEIMTCRRYWKVNGDVIGHWQENLASQAHFSFQHDPPMRAAQAVAAIITANRISRPGIATYNIGAITITSTTPSGIAINVNTAAAVANVPAFLLADSLSIDARL